MAEMVELVKDALLTDMRTRFASYFPLPHSDPAQDITTIVPTTFNVKTRAPQIILSDFQLVSFMWRSPGIIDVNEDREAGTVNEIREPAHRHLEFAVSAVARTSRAAERMAEVLTVYFELSPVLLEMIVGEGDDAFTFSFQKKLVTDFRDATQPNEGGLWFQEARARIVDIPIYDGEAISRKLATKVVVAVEDMDSEEELVSTEVEAVE